MKYRSQKGFALLAAVLAVALVAVALSVAIPSALTRGRREMETEMIFRGEQYKSAIGRYFRKHNKFPMKIEDLLRTNDRSYLRREFKDPMVADGEWRLIRLGPGGRLVGSVESPPEAAGPLGRSGRTRSRSRSRSRSSRGGTTGASGSSTLPIIGVGSKSKQRSFRVYNDYETYEGWEFYFDPKEALKKQAEQAQQQNSGSRTGIGERRKKNRKRN